MKTRLVLVIGIVLGLAASCIGIEFGVREYERRQQLAVFQTLVRQGSAESVASLGVVLAGSTAMSQIPPECERLSQKHRDLVEKLAAADFSEIRDEQQEYLKLLTAQSELMNRIGQSESSLLNLLKIASGYQQGDICSSWRSNDEVTASVLESAQNVWSMEGHFQATCGSLGLSCEPTFSKFQKQFAKNFKVRGLPSSCAQQY